MHAQSEEHNQMTDKVQLLHVHYLVVYVQNISCVKSCANIYYSQDYKDRKIQYWKLHLCPVL